MHRGIANSGAAEFVFTCRGFLAFKFKWKTMMLWVHSPCCCCFSLTVSVAMMMMRRSNYALFLDVTENVLVFGDVFGKEKKIFICARAASI
ncbi:hypothetical protein AOXY_G28464 [Acipenser oxyrinchus oxyrinchus]|uniref:Uncharacterized protein n=1 Tax=Acipenser oxyrinchus oxyrinchus TaxID=40147 RepID=A0AAD8CP81_ACIOX|nr:hypothetical protein AOXY_G28464 [Acipenser oxyrinchus oxyrinchus]